MDARQPSQNRVFINPEGYIEAQVIGDQTYESFHQLFSEADPLIEQLKNEGKPILGLVDLTKKGKYTPGSNKAAMEALEHMNYKRIAMYGAEAILKEVTEMIILAMGKKDNTQMFHDRQSSLDWLLQQEDKGSADSPVKSQ